MKFQVKFKDGSIVKWSGETGEDACRRAADCLRKTAVAWRPESHGEAQVYILGRNQIIG